MNLCQTLASKCTVALLPVILIWGCKASAPPKSEPVTEMVEDFPELPQAWYADTLATGPVDDGWLVTFSDTTLLRLVGEAMQHNYNLRAAATQINVAEGYAKKAGAALKPQDNLAFGSTAGGDFKNGNVPTDVSHGVSMDVAWEADVWGRVRSGASAALASVQAARADYEYARQSLAAQIAKGWFLATETALQLALADSTLRQYQEIQTLVETRLAVGKISSQDVHLAKADVASAEDGLRSAQGSFEQAVRSLQLLIGRYPSAELELRREFPQVPSPVPAGLPSELLERRPDMIAAERDVAAAFQLTEQAKAALMPRITLTGSLGNASDNLLDALNPTNLLWNVGVGVATPLLNRDALDADVEIATAQQEAAVAAYAAAALQAFNDVETTLSNERLYREREQYLQNVVDENTEALKIAKVQYEVGQLDVLSILQMQLRVVNAERSLLRMQNNRLSNRVNLHLALGGSFEETE